MPDLLKQLVWDSLVTAALKELFAAVPFLGWGPIGIIVSWAVRLFGDKLYAGVKMSVDLQIIAFKNDQFKSAFEKASIQLKIAAHDFGAESKEYQEARSANQKALADLVVFAA